MAVDFTARSPMDSCCIVTPESGAAPGIRHIAIRRKRTTTLMFAHLLPTGVTDNTRLAIDFPGRLGRRDTLCPPPATLLHYLIFVGPGCRIPVPAAGLNATDHINC